MWFYFYVQDLYAFPSHNLESILLLSLALSFYIILGLQSPSGELGFSTVCNRLVLSYSYKSYPVALSLRVCINYECE